MEHTEGGEPACFLNLVCEECGRVREDGRCPLCDPPAVEEDGSAPDPVAAREG
ncbi:hypothetical protein [Kitasatospora phosalacinea]|uniref:hypothetical protein n=1 Tax=Kitasatospora phosalacinea TaxID=2065 RepID=UPI000A58B668|nr:hypothetical protein [Kitasatospora phosalacinea]